VNDKTLTECTGRSAETENLANWQMPWKEDRNYPLSELARAAKVDNLNRRPLGVAEENVLGLEVAVDYAELGR